MGWNARSGTFASPSGNAKVIWVSSPEEIPLKKPSVVSRIRRHLRLTRQTRGPADGGTPPFLILFINSICNLTCEHCFYWQNLNQRDDLTFTELQALSEDLGSIENLNLSGGEPFMREEFDQIVRMFIRNNGVKQVYVPTNGYFLERTEQALSSVLEERDLVLFACELSLDGTEEYHNRFRGSRKSFQKAMETYDMLAELQKQDRAGAKRDTRGTDRRKSHPVICASQIAECRMVSAPSLCHDLNTRG